LKKWKKRLYNIRKNAKSHWIQTEYIWIWLCRMKEDCLSKTQISKSTSLLRDITVSLFLQVQFLSRRNTAAVFNAFARQNEGFPVSAWHFYDLSASLIVRITHVTFLIVISLLWIIVYLHLWYHLFLFSNFCMYLKTCIWM